MGRAYSGGSGNDVLAVPYDTDDDSGIYLAGLAGDDRLTAGDDDDLEDFVALYGGSGNDTYVMQRESCALVADISGNDTIVLPFSVGEFLRYSPYGHSAVIDGAHYYLEIDDMKLLVTNFAAEGKVETIAFRDGAFTFDELWSMYGNAARPGTSYDSGPMVKYLFDQAMARTGALAAQENVPSVGPGNPLLAIEAYFNEDQYLQNKTDAMNAQRDPLLPLYRSDFVEDLIELSGMTPLQHFMRYGAFERNAQGEIGIDPSSKFDASAYYAAKVARCAENGENYNVETLVQIFQHAGLDPVSHFGAFGFAEGLAPVAVGIAGVQTAGVPAADVAQA